MARRSAAIKRETTPDPLYNSKEVSKLINVVMTQGKKSVAEKIVYGALDTLADRVKNEQKSGADAGSAKTGKKAPVKPKARSVVPQGDDALGYLHTALSNVAPTVEVKSRRVGGATYQVPMEVPEERGNALAMRWIITAAKKRSEKTMALRLAGELVDAYNGKGAAIKTRDDVHRMANANKAFAHYRW